MSASERATVTRDSTAFIDQLTCRFGALDTAEPLDRLFFVSQLSGSTSELYTWTSVHRHPTRALDRIRRESGRASGRAVGRAAGCLISGQKLVSSRF
jgi:hypothetical protein